MIRKEFACTIVDVLNRWRLPFLDIDATIEIIPKIAEVMENELSWTDRERTAMINEAVALSEKVNHRHKVLNRLDVQFDSKDDKALDKFKAIDRAGKGYIFTGELIESLKDNKPPLSSKDVDEILGKVILQTNGRIYRHEFVQIMRMVEVKTPEQLVEDLFS